MNSYERSSTLSVTAMLSARSATIKPSSELMMSPTRWAASAAVSEELTNHVQPKILAVGPSSSIAATISEP
jgi:hypothetical protein